MKTKTVVTILVSLLLIGCAVLSPYAYWKGEAKGRGTTAFERVFEDQRLFASQKLKAEVGVKFLDSALLYATLYPEASGRVINPLLFREAVSRHGGVYGDMFEDAKVNQVSENRFYLSEANGNSLTTIKLVRFGKGRFEFTPNVGESGKVIMERLAQEIAAWLEGGSKDK
jgi:hypothetical protein